MTYLGACMIWLFAASAASASEDNLSTAPMLRYARHRRHGAGSAVRNPLGDQAFGRRALQLADSPTFPRYMTSRGQYLLGSWAFSLLAAFFFLLIVYLHKEVIEVAGIFGEPLSKEIIGAVKSGNASYLVIIFAMGSLYLFLPAKGSRVERAVDDTRHDSYVDQRAAPQPQDRGRNIVRAGRSRTSAKRSRRQLGWRITA